MRIIFEFETKYGTYRDALYFEDHAVPDDAAIEAMKQERLNSWIQLVENPPVEELNTVELDGKQYEKIEIDGQIMLKPLGV